MRVTVGYIPEVSNSIFPHSVTSVANTLYAYLNPNKRKCLRVGALSKVSSNEQAILKVYLDQSEETAEDENWELHIPNVYMRYRVEVEYLTSIKKKTAFQHPIINSEPVRA